MTAACARNANAPAAAPIATRGVLLPVGPARKVTGYLEKHPRLELLYGARYSTHDNPAEMSLSQCELRRFPHPWLPGSLSVEVPAGVPSSVQRRRLW